MHYRLAIVHCMTTLLFALVVSSTATCRVMMHKDDKPLLAVWYATLRSNIYMYLALCAVVQYLPNFFFGALLVVFGVEIISDWLVHSYFKVTQVGAF